MKDHIFELRRKIWIYDWSSQLHTQLKQLWNSSVNQRESGHRFLRHLAEASLADVNKYDCKRQLDWFFMLASVWLVWNTNITGPTNQPIPGKHCLTCRLQGIVFYKQITKLKKDHLKNDNSNFKESTKSIKKLRHFCLQFLRLVTFINRPPNEYTAFESMYCYQMTNCSPVLFHKTMAGLQCHAIKNKKT